MDMPKERKLENFAGSSWPPACLPSSQSSPDCRAYDGSQPPSRADSNASLVVSVAASAAAVVASEVLTPSQAPKRQAEAVQEDSLFKSDELLICIQYI